MSNSGKIYPELIFYIHEIPLNSEESDYFTGTPPYTKTNMFLLPVRLKGFSYARPDSRIAIQKCLDELYGEKYWYVPTKRSFVGKDECIINDIKQRDKLSDGYTDYLFCCLRRGSEINNKVFPIGFGSVKLPPIPSTT
jgi:hypothetical protein